MPIPAKLRPIADYLNGEMVVAKEVREIIAQGGLRQLPGEEDLSDEDERDGILMGIEENQFTIDTLGAALAALEAGNLRIVGDYFTHELEAMRGFPAELIASISTRLQERHAGKIAQHERFIALLEAAQKGD